MGSALRLRLQDLQNFCEFAVNSLRFLFECLRFLLMSSILLFERLEFCFERCNVSTLIMVYLVDSVFRPL